MNNRNKVSHSGVGSQKPRTSSAKSANTDAVDGAAAMLDKLRAADEEAENTEEKPESSSGTAPKALRDLRELIFLGRTTNKVNIGGFDFEVSTLSSNEKRNLVINLGLKGSRDLAAYIRNETMSIALRTVNGVPLEDLYQIYGGQEEELDESEKRRFIIGEMQSALVEQLFKVYEDLSEQSEKSLSPQDRDDIKK